MIEFSTEGKKYKYLIIGTNDNKKFSDVVLDGDEISSKVIYLRGSHANLMYIKYKTNDYRYLSESKKILNLRDKIEEELNIVSGNYLVYEMNRNLTSIYEIFISMSCIDLFEKIMNMKFGDNYIYIQVK